MCTYSQKIKNHIVNLPQSDRANLIDLAILLRIYCKCFNIGNLSYYNLYINTENKLIATKVFTLIKNIFKINSIIKLLHTNKSKYILLITPNLGSSKIINESKLFEFEFLTSTISSKEDYKSLIRSYFFACGNISNPDISYSIEFILNNIYDVKLIQNIFKKFNISSNFKPRKNGYILYSKDSSSISTILTIIGAHKYVLELENILLYKEVRNNINRVVNFETANLSRIVNASFDQQKNIKLIDEIIGINNLNKQLKEIAILRMTNPNCSLQELADKCYPPVSKSCVNHRLNKLNKLADEIRRKNVK